MSNVERVDETEDNLPPIEPEVLEDDGVEERAKRMGWKPKGEYDNRGHYMDAAEFVKKGEEDLPVLRARLRRMDDNFSKVLSELADNKQVLNDFREFATRGEQRAYERARRELTEKRDAAVTHADTETFKATQQEIDALDKDAAKLGEARAQTAPSPTTQQPAAAAGNRAVDPATQAWIDANPWFFADPQLHRAAKAIDADILGAAPGIPVDERLATVKAEVMRIYPDKFKNPLREKAAAVATPSGGGERRKRGEKSYDDLPPEAKKACDKFVKTIPKYTREDYVKAYDWE